MKNLIDASSLLLLIRNAEIKDTLDCLQESTILDLTFYEVGNAVWKERTLTKLITTQEAAKLGATAQTILAKINRLQAEPEDFQKILEIAHTEKITFYDASYVQTARKREITIITEDGELGAKAKKYVNVETIAKLLPQ